MLVYGDQERRVMPADGFAQVDAALAQGSREGLSDAFILASELAQGLVDAEFHARGSVDETTQLHRTALQWVLEIALRLQGKSEEDPIAGRVLAGLAPDAPVAVRQAEGYAHYALYPEAYIAAAAVLDGPATVIGLRSIGLGLAALVAAASGSTRLFSLRPVGPAFGRRLSVGRRLEAALLAGCQGVFAVVDEGPGLSGSSFAAVADWLGAHGVAREQIVFFPSHGGEPGSAALPERRAQWRSSRRAVTGFDKLFLAAEATEPLSALFADITGPATEPLHDLSGGAWRTLRQGPPPPAHTGQERRKFLLTSDRGRFLVKFAGLGPEAHGKLARGRALHAAGFTPEPLALRRGLLLERWLEGGTVAPRRRDMPERLGAYLGFRAREFIEPASGASLCELLAMAEHNLREAFGSPAALAMLDAAPRAAVETLQREVRPVSLDARLHAWEWLDVSGQLCKTDALDHARGHDLVGPQDIAWDVAGALIEFDLDETGLARLLAAMPAATRPSRALIDLLIPCYLGFQVGLWTFAAQSDHDDGRPIAMAERYGARLRTPALAS